MELGEKMSYLQGLLDGLDIDTSTKEGKLLVQMTEVMKEMMFLMRIWVQLKKIFTNVIVITVMIVVTTTMMIMILKIMISTMTKNSMRFAVLSVMKG